MRRSWLAAAGGAALAGALGRAIHRSAEWNEHVRRVASGPIDVAGIRAVIDAVVAGRPAGAVEVTETVVPSRPHDGLPERPEIHLSPRTEGAVRVAVTWSEPGSVDVFLDDDPPIELTAPVNVNSSGPERPFLDELREVVDEVANGRAHREHSPDGADAVVLWSDPCAPDPSRRRPDTWTPVAAWD